MYLTEEAAHSILQLAVSTPPPGEIVFSFADKGSESEDNQPSIIERNAAAHGEPWLTRYQPDILEQELRDLGFQSCCF